MLNQRLTGAVKRKHGQASDAAWGTRRTPGLSPQRLSGPAASSWSSSPGQLPDRGPLTDPDVPNSGTLCSRQHKVPNVASPVMWRSRVAAAVGAFGDVDPRHITTSGAGHSEARNAIKSRSDLNDSARARNEARDLVPRFSRRSRSSSCGPSSNTSRVRTLRERGPFTTESSSASSD
jgi:hypothetical protein